MNSQYLKAAQHGNGRDQQAEAKYWLACGLLAEQRTKERYCKRQPPSAFANPCPDQLRNFSTTFSRYATSTMQNKNKTPVFYIELHLIPPSDGFKNYFVQEGHWEKTFF